MKHILIVIDVQNDFVTGILGTPEARGIVPNIARKISSGMHDFIIFTRDIHNDNYLQTQEGKFLSIPHCIDGTSGVDIVDEVFSSIQSYTIWTHVTKNRFGCLDLIKSLNNLLHEIDAEIEIIGICTDICVITNALLIKTHFPETTIVVDSSCCAGVTPELHQAALDVMKSCQIIIK